MKLFELNYNGNQIEVIGSVWNGLEFVLVNGQQVSRKRNFRFKGTHQFNIPGLGEMQLEFKIKFSSPFIPFHLYCNEQLVMHGIKRMSDPKWLIKLEKWADKMESEEQKTSQRQTEEPKQEVQHTEVVRTPKSANRDTISHHFFAIGGLFFKLFKSLPVFKVALAGAAFAGWSFIFSWYFAVVLMVILIFHEYGHLRAMKKCGIKTKGMYLIPFFGGIAVGDKPDSHWHEVYISMMGPVYGLYMSGLFYITYLMTDNHFIGLVASFSALINLFNLLPVYPLDGGHVVKAIVLSMEKSWGLIALLAVSAVFFALCSLMGWYFLAFFIVIGVVDLIANWKMFAHQDKPKLDGYGKTLSLLWYLLIIGLFLAVIYLIAASALPGSEIAVKILQS